MTPPIARPLAHARGWSAAASPTLVVLFILTAGLGASIALVLHLIGLPYWASQDLLSQSISWLLLTAGSLLSGALASGYWLLTRASRQGADLLKEIEGTLRLGHSPLQGRADTATDAIVIVDEERCVHWVNRRACATFGYSRDEFVGLPVPQMLPVFMGQQMGSWLLRHGNGSRALDVDTLGVHADGTALPVSVTVSSVRARDRQLYTCIVRPATDAKWAARELMLRERALASSTNGITIVDMTQEGEPFIYVNPAFEDLTGYSAQEVLGRNARFLQRHDTQQEPIAALRQAIAENRSCHVVLRNYRKDGTLFWNDLSIAPVQQADGQVTHYVGIQVDITERMQAESALQLRTDRLNAVFALSPDGFVALDADRTVTIMNPAFERMTGLRASELVGQSADQFEEALAALCSDTSAMDHAPSFVDTQPQEPQECSSQGAAPTGAEQQREVGILHLVRPHERTLLRRTRRARAQGNETVMVFRDITRELEVDRMKSDFLSTAAHELRTPMSSIYGFAELLLRRKFTPEQQREMLATIHRQAGVLIQLVNELLDLARIEARRGKDFNLQWTSLQDLVRSTVDALLMSNDDRHVGLTLPQEPIRVQVDVSKMSLALTNILSNAYKYSPGGGRIGLTIVPSRRDGEPCVGISVVDHGMGMTPSQLAQVFDRFYRADASGNIPGTGLGMALVKEIAELHGGSVEVQSEFGKGTVVTLWLPRPQDANGQPWAPEPAPVPKPGEDSHSDIEHLHIVTE